MRIAAILLFGLLGAGAAVAAPQGSNDASVPKGTGAAAAATPLPSAPEAVVDFVTHAINEHDRDAMERLVNWDGVRPLRKRLTMLQIATSFGRTIKTATIEDFPPDGLQEAEAGGKYKLNMPVVKTLRVVYDEPADDTGAEPASVFLLGQKDGAFRIAVLNSSGQQRK